MISSVIQRSQLGRNQAVPLALLEDNFRGISTTPFTVVVTEIWEWTEDDIQELVGFLKEHRLHHIRRGWCKAGYAVVFRNETKAAMFRLMYPGMTLPVRGELPSGIA